MRGTDLVASVEPARRLRHNMTEAERALWQRLRDRRLDGHKFRRQHPIGPYVTDFYCEAKRLVVEVDGVQHAEQVEADARRTGWLEARGVHVVRVWNEEVRSNMDGVLREILSVIESR